MAQLSVKVYYIENKATKEIRKFAVDEDVAASYEYLIGKIRNIFPGLLRKELDLFWQDNDSDFISVSSDDELVLALAAIPHGVEVLKLYVKVKQTAASEPKVLHPGVVCDGCDSNITGNRFKCTTCYDFDLCSSCEKKGVHPEEHEFLCIKRPRSPNGSYYMRFPHSRGFHRSAGPWCGNRRGCKSNTHCQGGKPACQKDSTAETKEEGASEQCHQQQYEQMISQLAAGFGLDPEVATSFAKNMFEKVQTEQENSKDKKDGEKKDGEQSVPPFHGIGEIIGHIAPSLGLDPEVAVSMAQSLFQPRNVPQRESQKEPRATADSSTSSGEKMDDDAKLSEEQSATNNEQKMEAEISETRGASDGQNSQNAYEQMVGEFAKQFGLTRELQPEGGARRKTTNSETLQEKSEEYIFIEKKKADDERLTEEEKYDQRLNKALRQMEAMGFDNDGGWLRQLLISKELSIGRVLDALNPSM